MTNQLIIEKTAEYVKRELSGESTGHDWWHTYRVWKNAIEIGKKEKANLFIIETSALLHDIADWKFNNGDDSIGAKKAREWLSQFDLPENILESISSVIRETSFKGAGVRIKLSSLESKVVQDSDRLDALGAIGIGRVFAYGGKIGREMYNPEISPKFHDSFEVYRNSKTTSINHFHEKLLLLKDLMNTETGKKVAEQRHQFMALFLDKFYYEFEGLDLN